MIKYVLISKCHLQACAKQPETNVFMSKYVLISKCHLEGAREVRAVPRVSRGLKFPNRFLNRFHIKPVWGQPVLIQTGFNPNRFGAKPVWNETALKPFETKPFQT